MRIPRVVMISFFLHYDTLNDENITPYLTVGSAVELQHNSFIVEVTMLTDYSKKFFSSSTPQISQFKM